MDAAVGPWAALSHPGFRYFQLLRLCATVGFTMQGVAVGWQVYALTRDPLHLGYVGLAQFAPALCLTLFAGQAADRFERRRILAASHLVQAAGALGLWLLAARDAPVGAIYAVLVATAGARAFGNPAASALVPSLVPPATFTNAVAWSSAVWHTAMVAGPAAGGALYAWSGRPAVVYGTVMALELGATVAAAAIRPHPSAPPRAAAGGSRDLLAGLRYVWRTPVILGAISLDMVAVLLGGSVALLPVYARDILHVGPTGLGLLRSAPAAGATLMALALTVRPLRRRAGPALFAGVLVFGLATIAFGLARDLGTALAALLVVGAADMVSVYVRHTVVQLATSDAMRGRVSAVNLLFIGASNELGELESGVTAAWLGTERAVLLGGVGTCVVVALWALLFPALRRVDRLDPEALGAP
jgi:MFS family permease